MPQFSTPELIYVTVCSENHDIQLPTEMILVTLVSLQIKLDELMSTKIVTVLYVG